jgi:hypothetical protein
MPQVHAGPEGEAPATHPIRRTLSQLRDRSLAGICGISLTDSWARLFCRLYWCAPLQMLRGRSKRLSDCGHGFVDLWVAARTTIPVVLLVVSIVCDVTRVKLIVLPLGFLCLADMLIAQGHVVLFGGYWAEEQGEDRGVKSVHRLLVNALHNYAEVIAWFALFYLELECWFDRIGREIHPTVDAVLFSFATMTSFGYSDVRPANTYGSLLTLIQSAIGLMMALLILGLIVNALPPPPTRKESQDSNASKGQRRSAKPRCPRDGR